MKKDDRKQELDPEEYLLPTGVGGQLVPPADDSLFVPDETPPEDDRGVNEEDIVPEDDGLIDSGSSPEFDHSLRRRKTEPEKEG